ncbi:hypothetical protein hrd7_14410 [Leptolinea sp. HRD-7]|nr:hypothetical protein hrd7_14410 [Leptolinea sp. HRD-7]
MTIPQKKLILNSILLVGITFGLFFLFPLILGPKWGYITGSILYWIAALLFSMRTNSINSRIVRQLFLFLSDRSSLVISAIAFIPVFGVFFVSFLPNVRMLTTGAGLLVILMSLCNGLVEEYFWRGMYLIQFRESAVVSLIVSPLLFGTYHISLWFIKGITYQGGFMALVGGAYLMGLIWAWVTRKTGTITAVTVAHIFVNIFAFTGLFVQNGF